MDELVVFVKQEQDVCYSSLLHEINAFVLKEDLIVERLQLLNWKVLRSKGEGILFLSHL